MTAPPYECPTRRTGPSWASMIRFVAATSSANEVNGFCTQTTWNPFPCRIGISLGQLEPSAHAPCTKTMFFARAPAGACEMPRVGMAIYRSDRADTRTVCRPRWDFILIILSLQEGLLTTH